MQQKEITHWEAIENLPQIVKVNKERFSTNTAVESVDGTSYTYEELGNASRFLASMLHSAGIRKGDRVAILSENTPHWSIAYFGILASGATTVPILPDFRSKEIKAILEHAGAKGCIRVRETDLQAG